jgi:hypothetical protein
MSYGLLARLQGNALRKIIDRQSEQLEHFGFSNIRRAAVPTRGRTVLSFCLATAIALMILIVRWWPFLRARFLGLA